jgi:hypothetical protein
MIEMQIYCRRQHSAKLAIHAYPPKSRPDAGAENKLFVGDWVMISGDA